MRLEQRTLRVIKELAEKYFGEDCEVRIFGSRVDDTKKGGDIDIYIETSVTEGILDRKVDFLTELKVRIGDQKIDLIVKKRQEESGIPIYEFAKRKGIKI